MSSQQQDKLQNLFSTLKPLEPRAGLEQEIINRIQQEPQPNTSVRKRLPKWLAPSVAVASFVGCLVAFGGYVLHVTPSVMQQSTGSAPRAQSVMPAASENKQMELSDSQTKSALNPAVADKKRLELTQGLRITLSDKRKKLETADQSQAFLQPDDFKRVITELYQAGAQWQAVNGTLVTAADSVEWKDNSLYVRGSRVDAPYQVSVSGDPTVLRKAIEQNGSYIHSLQTVSGIGLLIETVGNVQ